MAVPVSPRTARRWKREHPETAEDRRCRWMRFISARENDAVVAFAGKHGQAAMPHLTGNSPRADMFMPRDKAAPKAVSNHVPKFGERQHWGLTSN